MIRLVYDPETFEADLGRADDGGVEEGRELETAVLISLLTDRRVSESEVPEGQSRAGWWGDAYADEEGDEIGSRLWLLERGTDVPDAPVRAAAYAREALRWLVDDGLATDVDATARRLRPGVLLIEPVIHLLDGTIVRYEVEV